MIEVQPLGDETSLRMPQTVEMCTGMFTALKTLRMNPVVPWQPAVQWLNSPPGPIVGRPVPR